MDAVIEAGVVEVSVVVVSPGVVIIPLPFSATGPDFGYTRPFAFGILRQGACSQNAVSPDALILEEV